MIIFVEARFIPGHGWGLFPTNAGSALFMDEKIPKGKELRADVTQPRNLAHHKKYWAVCAVVADATDETPEAIDKILKLSTGHCEISAVEASPGVWQSVATLKSIAFHNMDQLAFNEFFERCVRVIYERWYGTRHVGDNSRAVLKARIDDLLAPDARRSITTERRN